MNASPDAQSILYVDGDARVQELRWANSRWTWYQLSADFGAAPGAGELSYPCQVLYGAGAVQPGDLVQPNGFVAYHGQAAGSLYTLSWVQGVWKCQPAAGTADAPFPKLIAAGARPGLFLWPAEQQLYLVFRGSDGTLHELSAPAQAGQEGQLDWTHAVVPDGGHPAVNDPVGLAMTGYPPGGPGTRHLFYTDVDNHLWHLASQDLVGGWLQDPEPLDTALKGPLVAPGSLLSAWGFIPYNGTEYTVHVVYRGTDGDIYEVVQNSSVGEGSGDWALNDLIANAHNAPYNPVDVPKAAGNPVGYVAQFEGTQHVVYKSVLGEVRELYWSIDDQEQYRWQLNDFASPPNDVPVLPAAAGDPAGYSWEAFSQQHVIFVSQRSEDGLIAGGQICELYISEA